MKTNVWTRWSSRWRKLEDVLAVRRHGAEHEVFIRLEEFFR